MNRYEAIQAIMDCITDELVICNLGHPSQELYAIKDRSENFYMLGSMGLASSIGLGLAMCTDRKVVVIDGDGALLMNLGSLATIGEVQPKNLVLIVLNNKVYGSTGNQPTFTTGDGTSIRGLAHACGLFSQCAFSVQTAREVVEEALNWSRGTHVVEIEVTADRKPTGPVPLDAVAIKNRFMEVVCR